jgi:hypothetical protein
LPNSMPNSSGEVGIRKLQHITESSNSAGEAAQVPARKITRWLDAWSDPVAGVAAYSPCILTCDLYGDGDYRLVIADQDHKLKVRAVEGGLAPCNRAMLPMRPASASCAPPAECRCGRARPRQLITRFWTRQLRSRALYRRPPGGQLRARPQAALACHHWRWQQGHTSTFIATSDHITSSWCPQRTSIRRSKTYGEVHATPMRIAALHAPSERPIAHALACTAAGRRPWPGRW